MTDLGYSIDLYDFDYLKTKCKRLQLLETPLKKVFLNGTKTKKQNKNF